MRLLLTAILWIVVLGGTWAYVRFDLAVNPKASDVLFSQAEGVVKIQIARTFDCYGDPEFGEPAIKVTFGGKTIAVGESNLISADEAIELEISDVEQGQNTVTVFANALSNETVGDRAPAMRALLVRVHHDGHSIAEAIFHADGLSPSLGGDVLFEIAYHAHGGEEH